jgi:hypothetical protein
MDANETKWTKGPWVLRGADTYRWQIETKNAPRKATVVARITTPSRGGAQASDANARLIAAAPDLCASVRELYDVLYNGMSADYDYMTACLGRARESLAKIDGEQS